MMGAFFTSRPQTCCLIFLLTFLPLCANEGLRFDHLTIEDGLSQSSVHTMIQDHYGFMWFGTSDGLNRYDGYSFTIFKSRAGDPSSLSDSWITALFEDSWKTVWVGTYGGGLNLLNPDRKSFTRVELGLDSQQRGLGQSKVVAITEARPGMLWIGTDNNGIIAINPGTLNRSRIKTVPEYNGPPPDFVQTIFRDRHDRLWVGTLGSGLFRSDAGQNLLEPVFAPIAPGMKKPVDMVALTEDTRGHLWIGTDGDGLYRLNMATGQHTIFRRDDQHHLSPGSNNITTLYHDREETLWVATREAGLNRFEPETETFRRYNHDPYYPASLGDQHLLSLYEDRSGILWIGTYARGLSKINRPTRGFHHYRHEPRNSLSLGSNKVTAFSEDRRGRIWIGTRDAGLDLFDPKARTFLHIQHQPEDPNSINHNRITSILTDRQDRLWVGTYHGLATYDEQNNRFVRFQHDPEDRNSIGSNNVMTLFEDGLERLWVGTYGAGLELMDRETGRFVHYRHNPERADSISSNLINTLFEDREQRLWVGTEQGLDMMDRERSTFSNYQNDPQDNQSLGHNSVLCIYQQHEGFLWVGTYGGGLAFFDVAAGTFRHYREEDGLANNAIYGILEDDQQHLWISTNNGLSHFDPIAETFKNYDKVSGLQSNEFNRGAYFRSSTGVFYFGGINGFNHFAPDRIRTSHHQPELVLTAFHKLDKEARFSEPDFGLPIHDVAWLELEHDDNLVSFSYAAMDFADPKKNRFAYMLEGLMDTWIDQGTAHNLSFTNLDPGAYVLKVKGANSAGVWNETGISLPLTIKPPPWRTWWAYGLYLLLSIGLVALLLIYREQRKTREMARALIVEKARFANTVLHNIGNVLNSLRVSCRQSEQIVSKSSIPPMLRAIGLLETNKEHLDEYLIRHPKGSLIPEYLITASKVIAEEQDELAREFSEMKDQINLMRDIIETQQANANRSLLVDSHNLNDLVEDALKIQKDSLEKRHIKIHRRFSVLPEIRVGKAQLLHVLINIIKNAGEAMEGEEDERSLYLESGLAAGMVYLEIRDTGIGIKKEDLARLFTYGFTTKEEGHGFGLHSCEQTIKGMGGELTATSEGPGKGATFRIALPLGTDEQ